FDVHRLDLKTGELKLDTENPGMVMSWEADAQFQVRAGTKARADGGFELLVRDAVDQPWRTLRTWPAEEQGQIVAFGAQPDEAWLIANHDANTLRLLKVNVKTGAEEVVASDPEYDVSNVIPDELRRVPLAVAFTRARSEWQVLDQSVAKDLEVLKELRRGDVGISSRTLDGQKWVVAIVPDDGPAAYYLYDRPTQKAELLFTSTPKLEGAQLSRMEPVEYVAKDGLKIRGYLTLPVGVKPEKLPMVLLVHGGPWARDTWGFNPLVQFLANRGYAVLQVNFRGSTGYGKEFLNAGNREWAGTMHQDLIDGVNWAVAKGVADPSRVAIMGGSYGGYATLVGLTFTPDVFRCGVDIVGPSSIPTLLRSIPPYWAPMRAMFAKRVGDVETEEEFLKSRSPLYRVHQIKAPLLIGQGANDPRVKQAESDQIVSALRAENKPVQYVVYPDEGHGFARPENRLHFFAITEAFLAEFLGGRAEPLGNIPGHTGEIR
ncbi:MAG TPA: S9 family peptidase, partial [Gemmatales bacterium]|nr:S9 family peptidase [Gemmatales bacterium]